MCLPQACMPGSGRCNATGDREVCNPRGSACASTESCRAGLCVTRVCTPGSTSCVGSTGTRTCNADGLGYTAASCPSMNACLGAGTCAPWRCTPGPTAVCASSTTRQVCAPDGQGHVGVDCPAPANGTTMCAAGSCAITCNAGYGNCDGSATNGCEANLNTSATSCGTCGHACSSGYACQGGACVLSTPTCGASNFTVSCGFLAGPCPAHSTCTGTGRCTCNFGYTATTCSGTVCSGSCVYPNWWCI